MIVFLLLVVIFIMVGGLNILFTVGTGVVQVVTDKRTPEELKAQQEWNLQGFRLAKAQYEDRAAGIDSRLSPQTIAIVKDYNDAYAAYRAFEDK
jgi:hypothetical protein